MHKNVLAFIFLPSTAPRRAAPPLHSRSCAAPAICPQQHRPGSPVPAPPRQSAPSSTRPGSSVPATKPAPRPSFLPNFLFLTPLYFFLPAQGEVKKRPHTYPTFALSNPQIKMYACAVPTAHGRARVRTGAFSNYRAGGIVRGRRGGGRSAGDRRRGGLPGGGAGRWCSAGCCVFGCGRCAGCRCWGWCWCGGGVVLAGELLPGAADGGRPAGWWGGVNSGKKKSPCRR